MPALRSPLYYQKQPGGGFAVLDAVEHPGDIWYVGSAVSGATDGAGYGRSPYAPFATLAYALTQVTASQGDVIYILPGHAETTTAIAASVAGIKIVGLGFGRNRPTFTATTAASSLWDQTGANCIVENIRLVGAASGVTELLDLGAADFVGRRLSFEHGAAPLVAVTISAASHRFVLEDCTWLGTANGPDTAVDITAKSHDWRISRARFMYGQFGLDNELIKSAKANLGYVVEDWVAVGLDTLVLNLTSSSSGAPDGLISDGRVMYSAAIASVEDGVAAATSKGAAFGRVYGVDVTGKAGALIPLATAT